MKTILAMMTAVSLIATAACAATGNKREGSTRVERRVTFETVVGTVKSYVPGKKIVIVQGPNQTREFQIEQNAEVVGKIIVGRPAKIEFFKSTDGPERVVTIQEAQQGSAG